MAFRTRSESFFESLPEAVFADAPCVFVVSTGRCGTMLLTRALELARDLDVYHRPEPELVYPSRRAFWEGETHPDAYKIATIAARYDLIEDSFITCRTYVETNCRITYFAPHVASLFKRSKFIHLTRHPVAFVRSAMARGYYQSARADRGHIQPVNREEEQEWQQMDVVEKIAWNWNATNEFIERFKRMLAPGRIVTVRAEDLFQNPHIAAHLIEFCGGKKPISTKLSAVISKPINSSSETGPLTLLTRADTKRIYKIATLATQYRYEMDVAGIDGVSMSATSS